MSTGKLASYPWYPRDYLNDTIHMTLEEDGAYRRLLDWSWLQNEPIPKNGEDLARIMRVPPDKARTLWKRIVIYFPRGRNRRLERERAKALARIELAKQHGARGGAVTRAKWQGDGKGARPGNPTPDAVPSVSVSVSGIRQSGSRGGKPTPIGTLIRVEDGAA